MEGGNINLAQLKSFIIEQNKIQTDSLTTQIKQLTNYTEEIKGLLKDEAEKVKVLKNEVDKLSARNHILEKITKKNNIIIFNSHYKEGDLVEFFKNLTETHLKIKITDAEIDNIYLIGKEGILVKFVSFLTKRKILQNCKLLKDSPTNIVITEDFTEQERVERKALVQHMKTARKENKKAYVVRNTLYIEGKALTYKDLTNRELTEDSEEDQTANSEERRLYHKRKFNGESSTENIAKKNIVDYRLRSQK